MPKNPAVSVIMTVYNGERYVSQAIQSIQNQTLDDFEFVIVDDGSTDRTPEILAEAEADPRLKLISVPRMGRAPALNLAWTQAQGAYIANLDADDLAEPTRLEKQFVFLKRNPKVGLLGAGCKIVDEDTGHERIRKQMLTDYELRRALLRHNPFVHSSVMIPRYILKELGGYSEKVPVSIDYELWVRLAGHYQLANLPDILTIKRMNRLAYFHNRIPKWKKYQTRVAIRWHAWRTLSGSPLDLPLVFDPVGQWLHTRTGNAWQSTQPTTPRNRPAN